MKYVFLLIADDPEWSKCVEQALSPIGKLWIVREEALETAMNRRHYDLAIIDANHVPEVPKQIIRLRERKPNMHVVVASFTRTWRRAQEAMSAGASNYILKSKDDKKLREEIRATLEKPLPISQNNENSEKTKRDKQVTLTILMADNDVDFSETRAEFLKHAGYKVILAVSPADAKKLLENGGIDMAILDIRMANDDDEQDISGIIIAKTVAPTVPKIILTGFPSLFTVRDALKPNTDFGMPAAVNYVSKEEGPEVLIRAIADTIRNFVENDEAPKASTINTSKATNYPDVPSKNKPPLIRVLHIIIIAFPNAIGRFILDLFGRDKATDTTATMLGYIVILFVVLIIRGIINPEDALNRFQNTWQFFFPVK